MNVTIDESLALHSYVQEAMKELFLKRRWDRNTAGFLKELIKRVERAVPANFYGLDKGRIKIVVTFIFKNQEKLAGIEYALDNISRQINLIKEKLKKENGYDLRGYFARLDYLELTSSFYTLKTMISSSKKYFFKVNNEMINKKKFQVMLLMHKIANFIFPGCKFENEPLYEKITNQSPDLQSSRALIFSVQEINNTFMEQIKLAQNYLKEIKNYNRNFKIFDAVEHAEYTFISLKKFWDKILEVSRKLKDKKSEESEVYKKQIDYIRYEFGVILAEIGSYRTTSVNDYFQQFEGVFNPYFDSLYQKLKSNPSLTTATMLSTIFKHMRKIFQQKVDDNLLNRYVIEHFQRIRKREFEDLKSLHPNLEMLTTQFFDVNIKNPTFNDRVFFNIANSIYSFKIGNEYSALNIERWKKDVLISLGAFVDKDLKCVFKKFEIPLIFSHDEKIWENLEEIYEEINNKIPKKVKVKGKKVKVQKIIKTTYQLIETLFRKLKGAFKDDEIFEEELKEYVLIFLKKTRCLEVGQFFEKAKIINSDIKEANLSQIVFAYILAESPSALNIKKFEKQFRGAFGGGGGSAT